MNVAVLCEFSGIVRDSFIAAGHNAVSFDLLDTEKPGPHVKCDVMSLPGYYWERFDMAICHPPCTDLAISGARHFKYKKEKQIEALKLVRWMFELPIKRIAIENPISIISTEIRKPDQIINPWQFVNIAVRNGKSKN